MPDIFFKLVPHRFRPGQEIVEIHSRRTGGAIGMIYPEQGNASGIKLVSMHVAEKKLDAEFAGKVVEDDGTGIFPPVPAFHILFQPSPWYLTSDGLHAVKMDSN